MQPKENHPMTPSMTRLLPAITAALCLAASSITAVQAAPISIPLVNGDFNTIYNPTTGATALRFHTYGATTGVGPGVSVVWNNNYAEFSDGSTSSTVNIPGWIGTGDTIAVMTDIGDQSFRALANGNLYGSNGGTLFQTLSGVTAQADKIYTLSADLDGAADGVTVTYQLWFGTTPITATTPATWTPKGNREPFAVQFATGSTPPIGDLKVAIVLGGTGTQSFVDNVALTVVPEPTVLGLLALSALGLAARRRR